MRIIEKALELVADGMTLGLGTGRAASAFIAGLGKRVAQGLKVRGVPTSEASADQARRLNIPLVSLEKAGELDLAFDGADEVDPRLDLIKGFGGALVREKIVAASARKFIVLVTAEKLVPSLGQRGRLPVEVVPFGIPLCRRRLASLGFRPEVRAEGNGPFVSDNGNQVLDCFGENWDDPAELEEQIRGIPGVVGTGFFLGMVDLVLVESQEGAREIARRE